MNRTFILIVIILLGVTLPKSHAEQNTPRVEKLTLQFFGSKTCGECAEIKEMLLIPIAERYPEQIAIQFYDIEEKKDLQRMIAMEEQFKIKNPSPQELFFPDTVLLGYESIMDNGEKLIEHYLANPQKWNTSGLTIDTSSFGSDLKKRISQFTFLGVLTAGLIDGVNPCAIATMIFLISFLATQKRKRTEILLIGLCFTAAVFLTYLLLGIGAFQILTALKQYYWVSEIIRWSAVAVAAVIAILSFIDAFSYSKTGKADTIRLQLPKVLKIKIHKIISGNLKGSQLITGAIVTGFLVTLLEAVCTGQLYLPTIVVMTQSSGFKLQGWLYLIFYNFLFILPLLIVMTLAYFGLTWTELSKTAQKHLPLLKILLGIVLLGLAAFLAVAG